MIRYLCDTNIISELSKKAPDRAVINWASSLNRCGMSIITIEELCFGLTRRPNQRIIDWINRFIDRHVEIYPVTESIARRAGTLRGRLQSAGSTRTQADMLIASTAAEHNLVIVTRNLRDFEGCGVAVLDPFMSK
jgi:predicted nucleic acid-binding protein